MTTPLPLLDRAKMTTATTGTGTVTLGSVSNPASGSNYQTWAAAGAVNATVYPYLIEDGSAWEIGTGTYTTSGTTLSRTLLQSSTGSLLNLSGSATVACSQTAENFANVTTYTAPLSANFPWINQAAGATKTDITGALQMFGPNQSVGRNYSFAGVTAPATPWTRWMRLTATNNPATNYRQMGILVADGTNKNIEWGTNYNTGLIMEKTHNPNFTTGDASPITAAVAAHPPLIGITDDGTNLLFLISYDGVSSIQLFSESRTAFLAAGPTKVGFFINGYNYNVTMNIAHFGPNLPGPI